MPWTSLTNYKSINQFLQIINAIWIIFATTIDIETWKTTKNITYRKNGLWLAFVHAVGSEIEQAQVRLITAANAQMLFITGKVGNYILYHQNLQGWGSKIIKQLAKAIRFNYPEKKGYSEHNPYMCQFARSYRWTCYEVHWYGCKAICSKHTECHRWSLETKQQTIYARTYCTKYNPPDSQLLECRTSCAILNITNCICHLPDNDWGYRKIIFGIPCCQNKLNRIVIILNNSLH